LFDTYPDSTLSLAQKLTVRGQYVYEREDVMGLIKLTESGVMKFGKEVGCEVVGLYKLEEVDRAFETASANTSVGKMVALELWNW
jgi:D-arabinose 1-dehydrogenase-like Zn-dependent alcohol dehydrogenase